MNPVCERGPSIFPAPGFHTLPAREQTSHLQAVITYHSPCGCLAHLTFWMKLLNLVCLWYIPISSVSPSSPGTSLGCVGTHSPGIGLLSDAFLGQDCLVVSSKFSPLHTPETALVAKNHP